MKSPDSLFSLLGTIVVLGIVTTLVLPGRQTPQTATALGNSFSGAIRAAMGK